MTNTARTSIRFLGIMCFFPWILSCTPINVTDLTGPCPIPPGLPDYGPVAVDSGQSSVDIELDDFYMRKRIEEMVTTPSTENEGVTGSFAMLQEITVDGSKKRLLSVQITPWLKDKDGKPFSIPRNYRLQFIVTPHLITPTTVPNLAKRKQLLCKAGDASCNSDAGVVLSFRFNELFDVADNEKVACGVGHYDPVDAKVLAGLYKSLDTHPPSLVLDVSVLRALVRDLTGAPADLVGLNVATLSDLKIGLQMSAGATHTFHPHAYILSGRDWAIWIDTSLISSSISTKASAKVASERPDITVDGVSVTFVEEGLGVNIAAHLNACPGLGIPITTTVYPRVCKNAAGRSVITTCSDPPTNVTTGGLGPHACALLNAAWNGISDFFTDVYKVIFVSPYGLTTVTVGGNQCPVMSEVNFVVGSDDVFYATDVMTLNAFGIWGRSTFMDSRAVRSPQLPPSCQ
jgi:hypothetical protein